MKARPTFARSALVPAALALATLAGCSSMSEMFSGEKVDYRSGAKRTQGLEVPPDLTQLAREGRYQPPAAVISAAGQAGAAAPAGVPAVAPKAVGNMRIERDGQTRWLVVAGSPEPLWDQVRAFWIERGFTIASEDAKAGVMETDWAENRAKLPQGGIRAVIGRVFDSLYDTGERDRFRTRIERTATGAEVYISHRGLIEVFVDRREEQTRWKARESDPQLEAEFLARLMSRLGAPEDSARTAVAAAAQERPTQARMAGGSDTVAIEIDDGFDRAWRRVGVALDRAGFSVEDRNLAEGLVFVRAIDPEGATKGKSFFGRLLGGTEDAGEARRFRLQLRPAEGGKSLLVVLDAQGQPAKGEVAQQIAKVLLAELR